MNSTKSGMLQGHKKLDVSTFFYSTSMSFFEDNKQKNYNLYLLDVLWHSIEPRKANDFDASFAGERYKYNIEFSQSVVESCKIGKNSNPSNFLLETYFFSVISVPLFLVLLEPYKAYVQKISYLKTRLTVLIYMKKRK